MRMLIVTILLLIAGAEPAAAADWQPVSLAVECQSGGRTRVCTLLRGVIDAEPLLAQGRRGSADVIVWVNATEAGADDLVDLRFTSEVAGIDARSEVVARVDTFATDDQQMGPLRDALRRGMAPFVAARYPDAVRVELVPPRGLRAEGGSPWDFAVQVSGRLERMSGFENSEASLQVGASRTTREDSSAVSAELRYQRTDPDGYTIDAATIGEVLYTHLYGRSEHLVRGGLWLGGLSQVDGYRTEYASWFNGRVHGIATWRFFPIDDPRGNVLDLTYGAGMHHERHHEWSALEDSLMVESFPSHAVTVYGSMRLERLTLSIFGEVQDRLDAETNRRYFGYQSAAWQVARNVDLGIGLQERRDEGPQVSDPTWSYMGSFFLRFHLDRTNGARRIDPAFLNL